MMAARLFDLAIALSIVAALIQVPAAVRWLITLFGGTTGRDTRVSAASQAPAPDTARARTPDHAGGANVPWTGCLSEGTPGPARTNLPTERSGA